MEISNSKMPFLPSDWTIARTSKYVIRLVLFIIVPGLHQIDSGRRILGALLMALYFVSEYVLSYMPYDLSTYTNLPQEVAGNLSLCSLFVAWFLLVFDLRTVEQLNLRPGVLLVLVSLAGLFFVPSRDAGNLDLFIQSNDLLCPQFCQNDVIEYDPIDFKNDKISAGDYVLVDRARPNTYITKVVSLPSKKICEGHGKLSLFVPTYKFFCIKGDGGDYIYPHVVLGGPNPQLKSIDGRDVSMISDSDIHGVKLRKIGNLRGTYLINDNITNLTGRIMYYVYLFTGVSLFSS
jgi:hypothetical protein